MPDENSQLEHDASHRNAKSQSCLGQQRAQGHCGACLVSVGAQQRWLGVAVAGLFRTDAGITYLISLRCLALVVVAIPIPLCSPPQPAIMVAVLPATPLLPVETADSHQSLILRAEKFNFLYAVKEPEVTSRHW